MELLKIISKKNNKLVLELLSKYDALHYSAIKKKLKIYDKLLNNALDELVNAGLVEKEIENPNIRTSKVFYSLTDFGREAVKVYDFVRCLEKKREPNIIIGDNNIIANNINNSNISFKK
jgi:DNA-binding HxlR family transcriptional regulator